VESANPDLDPRKQLEALQKELAPAAVQTAPPDAKVPRLRSLVVDLGPPRSEVFVSGRLLGRTPYAGQLVCTEGEELQLDVVPVKGMPLRRKLHCRADILLAQE